MPIKVIILTFVICLVVSFKFHAQDCHCTIRDVLENDVIPCDYSVGLIDTVYTTAELRAAINQSNAVGGNRTILIADGSYPIASTSWYPYITGSNIVFRSLSGDRDAVILTGQGMQDVSPGTEIGIYAVGDNITIANLTIREVGNHGITVSGENLFVFNVRIQNTFEQMLKGVSADDGGDFGTVKCSLFEYTEDAGPQWYIGGLDIHDGDEWIVSDNIFKNIASPGQAHAEHAIHFWNFSSNNLIERNWIINCDRGVGFGLGSSPNEGGIIRNNMIYNDGHHIFDDVGIGLENSPYTQVYNNTIYIDYPNAIEYRFPETVEVEIFNNLSNQRIHSRDGGQAQLSYNFTTAQSEWFVDLLNGDLHLIERIDDIVDQGMTFPTLEMDFDQDPRPQGDGYDIGAEEYEIISSSHQFIPGGELSVYPNPTTGIIHIPWLSREHKVNIFDATGCRIAYFDCSVENCNSIDLSTFNSGIYLLTVYNPDSRYFTERILLLKE